MGKNILTKTLHRLINWMAVRGMLTAYSSDKSGDKGGLTIFLLTTLCLAETIFGTG
jgi:hypothetical protein